MTRALLGSLFLILASHAVFAAPGQPSIAIIMDDIGYRYQLDQAALELPGPLTFSILPHTPGAQKALRLARESGKEAMLHLPMQGSGHHSSPNTLTRDMDWATFVNTVRSSLAAVPGVVAVNNHEGSLLTSDLVRMHWLMQELSQHPNLLFVDSRTTHLTVALETARTYGVPAARRDIFLDHEPGHIEQQFEKLISKARRNGTALGIAHPHPGTVAFLSRKLPELEQQGIRLVKLSQMVRMQQLEIARR